MPVDLYDDEDDKSKLDTAAVFKDFDCPECNANNPCEQPLIAGDEVLCNYCGCQYRVLVTDSGRMKLKEL